MDRVAVSIVCWRSYTGGCFLFLHWHIMISLGKGSWMGVEHAFGFFVVSFCIDCSILFF
jgi:hypothetical protein